MESCKYCGSEKTKEMIYPGFMRDYCRTEIVHEKDCPTQWSQRELLVEIYHVLRTYLEGEL